MRADYWTGGDARRSLEQTEAAAAVAAVPVVEKRSTLAFLGDENRGDVTTITLSSVECTDECSVSHQFVRGVSLATPRRQVAQRGRPFVRASAHLQHV